MVEAVLNELRIADFSKEVVSCFLDALYGKESSLVHASWEVQCDVLRMADKYDSQWVKLRTADVISKSIAIANCSSIWQMANSLHIEPLMKAACDYMKTNLSELVMKHSCRLREDLGTVWTDMLEDHIVTKKSRN